MAGFLLVVAGRLTSFWTIEPQSSDPMDLADPTTLGAPAAMDEWQWGALGGALYAEMVVA